MPKKLSRFWTETDVEETQVPSRGGKWVKLWLSPDRGRQMARRVGRVAEPVMDAAFSVSSSSHDVKSASKTLLQEQSELPMCTVIRNQMKNVCPFVGQ